MQRYSIRMADWARDSDKLKAIRHAVFVLGQGVPAALEWDGRDESCLHAIAEDAGGDAIGCGRLLPDGHLGRMAVIETWRGQGVGSGLLAQLLEAARARNDVEVVLHAQHQAVRFYLHHGFAITSAEFLEAGIPHVELRRRLRR